MPKDKPPDRATALRRARKAAKDARREADDLHCMVGNEVLPSKEHDALMAKADAKAARLEAALRELEANPAARQEEQEHLDQFFTKPAVAKQCWDWLHREVYIPADAIYVEPSAGGGAFYNLMPPKRRIGYEVDKELAAKLGVQRKDFLTLHPLMDVLANGPIVVVGNPPYGKRSQLAADFISKSFELGATYVAMVLPAMLRPYEKGTGGYGEKRVRGGHSIAWLDGIGDRYDLPDGGDKEIMNTCFVVFKAGPRPAAAQRTCDSFIKIYSACSNPGDERGLQHLDKYDCFLSDSFFPKQPPKIVFNIDDQHYQSGHGIILLREKEKVLAALQAADWAGMSFGSANKVRHLSRWHIHKVVMDAGFIDGQDGGLPAAPKTCNTYADVFCVNKKAGRGMDREGAIYFPHMNLPQSKTCPPRFYDEVVTNEMVGVRPLRSKEALLEYLRGLPVEALTSGSTNRSRNASCGSIRRAIIAGGFID